MASKTRLLSAILKSGSSGLIPQISLSPEISLGGGTDAYDSIALLPLSNNATGDQAFVSGDSDRLYIWNGTGWFNIALINTNPSIVQGPAGSYQFEIDGTPIEITLLANDPEGIPITWSYSVTSGSLTNGGGTTATVSQNNNVFTITPTTNTNYGGVFDLTFTASDGINIDTAVSTFTLTFITSGSAYTSLLAKATGTKQNLTFIDGSTNALTLTPAGASAQTTISPYKHGGYSTYFDGTGDYIQTSTTAAGSGDFTIEGWIYYSALPGTYAGYYDNRLGNTGFGLYIDQNGALVYANNTTVLIVSSVTAGLNQWHHFAFVRASGTVTVYIDGVSAGSVSDTRTLTNSTVTVGQTDSGSYTYTGYLSNIRFVASALYTSAFTPPTAPLTAITNTILLTCQSNRFVDNSANGFAITPAGNTLISDFVPFEYLNYVPATHGASVYLDGSNSYIDIANDASNQLSGASAYTIECWIYPTAGDGTERRFLNKNPASTYGYVLGLNVTTNAFYFRTDNSNTIGTIACPSGRWSHCAVSYDGTTTRLYVNGVLSGSATGVAITNDNYNLRLGSRLYDASMDFTGYISDVRLVNGTALYTSAFTPPSAPLTAVTNTALLMNFTNAGVYDASQLNALTTVGNATSSTAQTKYAAGSVYFDGSGDYLITSASAFAFGTGDFTVEAWVYMTAYTGSVAGGSIFGTVIGSKSGYSLNTGQDSTSLRLISNASGTWADTLTTGSGLSLNTWTHIAMSRNGANLRIFKDGVVIGSTSSASTLNFTGTTGWIGRFSDGTNDRYFTGYIEDVRVTKGLARYTADFTPPTSELLG